MHFCIFLADFLLPLFTLSMPANETNGISCRIMNEIRNAGLKYRERDEEKTLTLIKLGANRRRGAELTLLVGEVISSAHKCARIGQGEPTSDVRTNDKERTAEPCPN